MRTKKVDVKKISVLAMLTALSYAVMLVIHVPVSFLTFDPKDVVITIGGMLYGPLSALIMSTVVALLEMVTVSTTGFIGFFMNILSSAAFCCTAAFFYKKRRTLGSAYLGLLTGIILSTIVMLLWNYFLTPIFLKVSKEVVLGMMLPLLVPFNLIKGGINATATALLYKPIAASLRKTGLLPKPDKTGEKASMGRRIFVWLAVALVFAAHLVALYFLIKAQQA